MARLKSVLKRGFQYVLHGVPNRYVTASVTYSLPDERLAGKKIVVTGGAGGLGFAMAKKFKSEKADVLIAGRNIEKLREKAEQLGCEYAYLDLQCTDEFMPFFTTVTEKIGLVDCLVNNAGISLHEGGFMKVTLDSFDAQMNTNLRGGVFYGTRIC